MIVRYDDLKPYKSLILAQACKGLVSQIVVERVIRDFKSLLNIDGNPDLDIITEGPTESIKVRPAGFSENGQMHIKFLHYTVKRAPGWYRGKGEVQDTLNHLIVACQLNRQVSLYISDSRMRTEATRQIRRGEGDGLGALEQVAAELLNAAFVKGPTRTVWLSGIHAPVRVKADSKILTGLDLRVALDPLGDQSYYFTAARSRVPKLELLVGVSPRNARVWVGATSDWDDFKETVASLLYQVETTTHPETKPLPALAVPANHAPLLTKAYELRFLPPELLADDPTLGPEKKEQMERWAYQTQLKILKPHKNSLEVEVIMDDVSLGTLKLTFDTSDVSNVKIEAEVTPPDPVCPDTHSDCVEVLKEICQNARWINVWYESGHTLSDGVIFEVRHRDEQFNGFLWCDFKDYDIGTEKPWKESVPPDALDLIGTKNSLFDWVLNNWPPRGRLYSGKAGWLACDDRPMEIADFIHLDVEGQKPVLTQIHVKRSQNNSATRGISVFDYEAVTSQAVKNMRYLDSIKTDEGLRKGLKSKIGKLVWHDRLVSTREKMLKAIAEIETSYERAVVILQPSVRRSLLEEVRKAIEEGKTNRDADLVRRLDTLLLSTQASCHSLGADLWVLADKA